MSTTISGASCCPPPLVCQLVERAERLCGAGDDAGRLLFMAAIATDPTPFARIAFAASIAEREPISAIDELLIAWDEARQLESPAIRSLCCRNLSILCERIGDATGARQYQQLALAAEMETPEFAMDATLSTDLLMAVAAGWSSAADFESAERLLTSVDSQADEQEEATLAMLEGVIAAHRGQYSAALRHLMEAFDLYCDAGNSAGMGETLLNVGHVLRSYGHNSEARRVFQIAEDVFRDARLTHRAEASGEFVRELAEFQGRSARDPLRN